ncbi:hypothetical protein DS835_06200 [Lactobacillus bombicola]|uniref:Uncharacterized protein n=1 Tax=Lactobacillus bombicola TaxID=1505723 RepID=A0A396T4B8_9LACO|nr:hypothetical protein DS835_06200 [Lactobacillus bombicola]
MGLKTKIYHKQATNCSSYHSTISKIAPNILKQKFTKVNPYHVLHANQGIQCQSPNYQFRLKQMYSKACHVKVTAMTMPLGEIIFNLMKHKAINRLKL